MEGTPSRIVTVNARSHSNSKPKLPVCITIKAKKALCYNEKSTASILVSTRTYLQEGEAVGEIHRGGVVETDDHYNTIVEGAEVQANHHMYFAVAEKIVSVHMRHAGSGVSEGID